MRSFELQKKAFTLVLKKPYMHFLKISGHSIRSRQ